MKKYSAVVVGILLIQGAAWGQASRAMPKAVNVPFNAPAYDGSAVTLKFSPADGVPLVEKASAVSETPEKNDPAARPFSDIPSCRVLDAAFFRQPTRAEGIRMLSGCLRNISARYDMSIHAADLEGILLIVSGSDQSIKEFSQALRIRGNELFGYPARVVVGVAN